MKSKINTEGKGYGKRLRLSHKEVDYILQKRATNLDNINNNTALDIHCENRGIDKKDIVSVKHWQSGSGDYRFSIVTKENLGLDEEQLFGKVNDFISNYSPDYKPLKRKRGSHLLVMNPADIHIGKYANEKETNQNYNNIIAVERVLEGVSGLIDKAKGFDIDRVLF